MHLELLNFNVNKINSKFKINQPFIFIINNKININCNNYVFLISELLENPVPVTKLPNI